MRDATYALGLDFGTNSVRALIAHVGTGEELATGVCDYPSGEHGVIVDPADPLLARQHPRDYETAMVAAVREAVAAAGAAGSFEPRQVVGIGVDTTGSTPLPIGADGRPLALAPEFEADVNAMAWLWKDHTSIAEAEAITEAARDEPYLPTIGGAYSSEWFWAKVWHCMNVAPKVFEAAETWVELCDYIPALLTGQRPQDVARSACAAGHKALWNRAWGGLPSEQFLARLSPQLAQLRGRLYDEVQPIGVAVGLLGERFASTLGLEPGTPVSVGALDAHLGAVGSHVEPGVLIKILGTSSCDILVAEATNELTVVPGICGIAEDSVLPGMLGLEAGQAAVGDLFHWAAKLSGSRHDTLQESASRLRPGQTGLLALDWNNGNRSILMNQSLSGLLIGHTLHTSAPEVYRAMIEASAFGALKIIERLEAYGVEVARVVACGGITDRSPLVMQTYANVLNRTILQSRSAQTCALGAAVAGAVAGGAHPDVPSAQSAMCGFSDREYIPEPHAAVVYRELYALYSELHDAFGVSGERRDLSSVMKQLRDIRRRSTEPSQ
jgi:L-ribulokinase